MFKLSVGVKLGVCAKTISVGDGDKEMISVGDEETTGEGDKKSFGDGDKATVGSMVGVTADGGIIVGLRVGVGEAIVMGLTDASLRTELFCFIKIKTKITTIIVNKEIVKKTNLE